MWFQKKKYKHHPAELVKIEVLEIPIVLCAIRKSQQTSRGLIPPQISLTEAKEQMSFCSSLVYAVSKGSLREIGEAVNLDYISEPVRSRLIPDYREVKTRVLKAGAYGCNVSGGGSSLFPICEIDKAAEVAAIMNTHFTQRSVENEVIITRASNRGIIEIDELSGEYFERTRLALKIHRFKFFAFLKNRKEKAGVRARKSVAAAVNQIIVRGG